MKYIVFIAFICTIISCKDNKPNSYEEQLVSLRNQYKSFHAHAPRFFLFGMGNRAKFVYKNYQLISIDKDSIVFQVDNAISDSIMPSYYMVQIKTNKGDIYIKEDEKSIWIIEDDNHTDLLKEQHRINLPSFNTFKYGNVLRVLHHEILFNIRDSRIYPNLFVYKKPFYRDAFMVAQCLEKTNNINIITPWLQTIDSIYDMQNHEAEVDNIGEVLYLLSFIPQDSNIVIRKMISDEIDKQTVHKSTFQYIKGHTDGSENAEYQTQILKFALRKNNLNDTFTTTPKDEAGDYFNLCWFTKGNDHSRDIIQWYKDIRFKYEDSPFPYLQWARSHYYNNTNAAFNSQQYPLSWEKRGGSAHFEGMRIISENAVDDRICYPHAWTAAEMFLKLYNER